MPCGRPASQSVVQSARPYSGGRTAPSRAPRRTSPGAPARGTDPTVISRAVRYGKAASERSSRVTEARMSRARGPQSPKQTRADGHVAQRDRAVVREMLPEPRRVVVAERRPGHEQERVVGEPRHGEVRLDPAAPVEQLGVDDRADGPVDVVGAHPAEEGRRARPADLELGERGLVEERRPPAGSRAPRPRSPATSASPPSRAAGGLRRRRRRVRTRTSSAAPSRTSRRRPRPDRPGPRTPARSGAAGRPGAPRWDSGCRSRSRSSRSSAPACRPATGSRPEPPDVHLPEVELGLAVDDPRRHLPADPAGAGDAVGAEAGGHEEATDLALAEDELVVRREGLRPVDHPVDPGVLDRRHSPDRASMIYSKRGQSGARSLPLKSAGTPSSDHGAGSRS